MGTRILTPERVAPLVARYTAIWRSTGKQALLTRHLLTRVFVLLTSLMFALSACNGKGDGQTPSRKPNDPEISADRTLNIYNWSDYIAENTIADFEKETGIKVQYDVFDSNEVLEAKLLAGNTGYDIVVPSASFVARQIKAGIFQTLNRKKLPNYKNLDRDVMMILADYDAGNEHVVPWMWGTTGIGYNASMLKKRLPGVNPNSWDILFKPENISKLKDCGVAILDTPTEVFPIALRYLGLRTDSQDKESLAQIEKLFVRIRPSIRYFHSSQYINDLANGELCLVLGWSGDVLIARRRAAEARNRQEIEYVIPKEGSLMWIDTLAIPKDAPHRENAYKFLNYVMQANVAASVTNHVNYANGNTASLPYVKPEIVNDKSIYPSEQAKEKLFSNVVYTPTYERLMTRTWTRIKTQR